LEGRSVGEEIDGEAEHDRGEEAEAADHLTDGSEPRRKLSQRARAGVRERRRGEARAEHEQRQHENGCRGPADRPRGECHLSRGGRGRGDRRSSLE
jgi:hypothetical protein